MDDIGDIAGEGFLHNHHGCIQQQVQVSDTDMDHFLDTLGLSVDLIVDKDFHAFDLVGFRVKNMILLLTRVQVDMALQSIFRV